MRDIDHKSSPLSVAVVATPVILVTGLVYYNQLASKLKARRVARMIKESLSIREDLLAEREQLTDEGETPFIQEVAAEVAMKFGRVPKTSAEWTAARLLAIRVMRDVNHRWTHCQRDLPKVLLLVSQATLDQTKVDSAIEFGAFEDRYDEVFRKELSRLLGWELPKRG